MTSIASLLTDLLDRVAVMNSPSPLTPIDSRSLDDCFHQSLDRLDRSIKQLFAAELNLVVENGSLTQTTTSTTNHRHSRYYNPAMSIKQSSDLRRRLQWLEQRQMIVKQLNRVSFSPSPLVSNALEKIWFDQRRLLSEKSEASIENEEQRNDDGEEIDGCARCRLYRRKTPMDRPVLVPSRSNIEQKENVISSLAKIADRLGSSSRVSSNTKKKAVKSSTDLPQRVFKRTFSSIDSNPKRQKRLGNSRSPFSLDASSPFSFVLFFSSRDRHADLAGVDNDRSGLVFERRRRRRYSRRDLHSSTHSRRTRTRRILVEERKKELISRRSSWTQLERLFSWSAQRACRREPWCNHRVCSHCLTSSVDEESLRS